VFRFCPVNFFCLIYRLLFVCDAAAFCLYNKRKKEESVRVVFCYLCFLASVFGLGRCMCLHDGAKKKIHVKNVKKAASLALLDFFF